MSKKIPVILDGDPGHDDAIAWVLAAASPMLDIKAVTSVCGNQTIEKTTYNAGRIMALTGLTVPLAMGRVKPLVADAIIAPTVHGNSGLDGPTLPEPAAEPVPQDAVVVRKPRVSKWRFTLALVGQNSMLSGRNAG